MEGRGEVLGGRLIAFHDIQLTVNREWHARVVGGANAQALLTHE